MFGPYLWIIFAATAILIGIALSQVELLDQRSVKRLLFVYAAITGGTLIVATRAFLGWTGTPPDLGQPPLLMQWTGHYAPANQRLTYTSQGEKSFFRLPELGSGEYLTLIPVAREQKTGEALSWSLKTNVRTVPLRIGGDYPTIPATNKLAPGDMLIITSADGRTFYRVIVSRPWYRFWSASPSFLYNQGAIAADGTIVPDLKVPLVIQEGAFEQASLAAMLERVRRQRTTPPRRSFLAAIDAQFDALRGDRTVDGSLTPSIGRDVFFDRLAQLRALSKDIVLVRPPAQGAAGDAVFVRHAGAWRRRYAITRADTANGRIVSLLGAVELNRYRVEGGSAIAIARPTGGWRTLRVSTDVATDPALGQVADVAMSPNVTWRLPEKLEEPFVISSRALSIDMPALVMDGASAGRPMFAKLKRAADGTFVVTDGTTRRGGEETRSQLTGVSVGEPFRISNGFCGASLRFIRNHAAFPFTGASAAGAIFILTMLFCLYINQDRASRPRLHVFFAAIFFLSLTLLVVRLLLAYRLAAFPPRDATPAVLALFHSSLTKSLFGLIAVPLLLLSAAFLSARATIRWPRVFSGDDPKHAALRLKIGKYSAVATIVLVALNGRRESLFGVRVSSIVFVTTVVVLAAVGIRIGSESLRRRHRISAAMLLILLPVGVMVLIVRDFGFAINLLPFGCAALLIALWNWRGSIPRYASITTVAVLALIVGAILFRARLVIGVQRDNVIERLTSLPGNHIYYRLVSTSAGASRIMEKVGDQELLRFDLLRRNLSHHWQMMLYASEGAANPRGFGRAELSRAGTSYATTMTDSVFSILILSEHGRSGGVALLLIYIAIGGSICIAAGFLVPRSRGRAFALAVIGLHFIFVPLYLASTNVGWLVFTGQNLPFLSLPSGSDLAVGAVVLICAVALMRTSGTGETRAFFDGQRWASRISVGTVSAAVIWTVLLAVWIGRVGADDRFRADFRVPAETLDSYRANLASAQHMPAIALIGTKLQVMVPAKVSWLERRAVDRFNASPNKYERESGLYYLATDSIGRPIPQINDLYLQQTSPFRKPIQWEGTIATDADAHPTFAALTSEFTLRPVRRGRAQTIPLYNTSASSDFSTDRVVLVGWKGGPTLCEISVKEEGKVVLYPAYRGEETVATWNVMIDGERLTRERALKPGDIITLNGTYRHARNRNRSFSHAMMYLGVQAPFVVATLWRDGKSQRVLAPNSIAPLAAEVANAFDAELRRDPARQATLPSQLRLTLDISLHNELEEILAKSVAPLHATVNSRRRQAAALTVMDAFSGDILALPEWTRTGRAQRNWNLRNHVIGSTVKPLIFSTIAAAYEGSGFDVTHLRIANPNDDCDPAVKVPKSAVHQHCVMAGIPLSKPWDCFSPRADFVGAKRFLVESRNYFAVSIGMMGMVTDRDQWRAFLKQPAPRGSAPVMYEGAAYGLDLRLAEPGKEAIAEDGSRILPDEASRSLLFTTMPRLFNAQMRAAPSDTERADYAAQEVQSFIPSLAVMHIPTNHHLLSALPDPVTLDPGMHYVRTGLIRFLIGSGQNGLWNNIRLAESAARLATGRKVHARIETGAAAVADPMPAPIGTASWRHANLVDPLEMVGRNRVSIPEEPDALHGTAGGTADFPVELAAIVEQEAAKVKRPFRAMFKTGTLNERTSSRYESEMLMFVVGEWGANGFVAGRTIAGYLYLPDAKVRKVRQWSRLAVAKPILERLVAYLAARELPGQSGPPDAKRNQLAASAARPGGAVTQ